MNIYIYKVYILGVAIMTELWDEAYQPNSTQFPANALHNGAMIVGITKSHAETMRSFQVQLRGNEAVSGSVHSTNWYFV